MFPGDLPDKADSVFAGKSEASLRFLRFRPPKLERTAGLRESIERLSAEIRENVGIAIGEAQGSADRLAEAATAAKPDVTWLRDATVEASNRLSATGAQIAEQRERFTALLSSVDDGVEDAQSKLAQLASTLVQVEREAASLSNETGPALVASRRQPRRQTPATRRRAWHE